MHKAHTTDHPTLKLIAQDIAKLKRHLQQYSSSKNNEIESLIETIKLSLKNCTSLLGQDLQYKHLSSVFNDLVNTYHAKAGKGVYATVNQAMTSGNHLLNILREQSISHLSEIKALDKETYVTATKTTADNDPIIQKRMLSELPTPSSVSIFSSILGYANLLNIFSSCLGSTASPSNLDSRNDRYTQHASALKTQSMVDTEPTDEEIENVIKECSM